MNFVKRTLPVLLGIFLLSVVVRVPQLNRPLSGHHEFCSAVALRIMQIWYDNGIESYKFNPVMSYNNDADKGINNHANQSGKMVDQEGNYYYVSHPPFAYYFPYFVFKILNIRPDVLPLQIFSMVLHFISGMFVYFTVCLLSFNRARALPYRSAIVAFSIYIFLPPTLWFQGNVYMSDMAVHALFVIGVYVALKMIIRQKFYSPKYIFFYVLVLCLMLYTSWLGIFFAIGILIYALLHVRDIKGFSVLIWTTLISLIVMLRLIAYQYAQINGLAAYVEEMFSRYLVRGSVAETDQGLFHFMFSYLWYLKTILYNYLINYTAVFVVIGIFFWLAISRKKLKIVFSENGYRFIWLSVMPIVLLHIFLLNYSVHDFTTLYASLFYAVLAGILYDKVKKSGAIPLVYMRAGLLFFILAMVVQYQYTNRSKRNDDVNDKAAGDCIRAIARNEEVVFVNRDQPSPQMVFYAARNLRYAKDEKDAREFLTTRNAKSGVMLSIESGQENACRIIGRINADSLAK